MGIEELSSFRKWSLFPGPAGSEERQAMPNDPTVRNPDSWRAPKTDHTTVYRCTNETCYMAARPVTDDTCQACDRKCEADSPPPAVSLVCPIRDCLNYNQPGKDLFCPCCDTKCEPDQVSRR